METEIQNLLDHFGDLREKANVNTCFGEPVTTKDRTVIPVAEVSYAFGMGIGHAPLAAKEETPEKAASRGGGGVRARPLGLVEVTPEGTWVRPIIDEQKVALAGVLLIGWAVFCLARTLVKIFRS
jgi:uncharacterized spore protein YtfJ